ncbi:hypothetical protein NJC40_00415 [Pseudomonas sp. 21LCFQ02]|uniref:hypothetical protein n=1 Tax=Pseudomonas sp. 21LCFQ02 TaxID=2957505 RepID=UPI00209A6D79|nr:hypothetical protein [Pseudomonas sp. 21LCFQ02]MCO8166243.1 hypothetical protein [Pseudomonas sp. 21LCFQ02]
MATVVKSEVLTVLCTLLKESVQPSRPPTKLIAFERRLLKDGMTTSTPLGDYLILSERRGYNSIERLFEELLEPLEIPKQWVYISPEFPEDEAYGYPGLTAVDAVALLIELEHLGLQVHPQNLIAVLACELGKKQLLTQSELLIVRYDQDRRKRQITLRADLKAVGSDISTTHHTDANGYQVTMTWAGSVAIQLQVQGPDYVEPLPQEFVTCEYCKHQYLTNDSMEARAHASEHEWTEQLFDPVPDARFAERLASSAHAELVDSSSPLWMHEAVYQRARAFRREFRYDRVQWDGSNERRASEGWHGYLFAGDSYGTIAGACGFYHGRSDQEAGQWGLHWIWLAPKFRHQGILKAHWADFLSRYGEFYVEPPISEAMQGFIRKHGSDCQKMQLQPQPNQEA